MMQEATPGGGIQTLRPLCRRKENSLPTGRMRLRSTEARAPPGQIPGGSRTSQCPCEGRASPPSAVPPARRGSGSGGGGEPGVGAARGEQFADHWSYLRTGHFASQNPPPWRYRHYHRILGETGLLGYEESLSMAAPAQRTPVPGPSPDWNVAGRVTQACRPYAATEGREDVSWLASRESTEVSWRVLQAGEGGGDGLRPAGPVIPAGPLRLFRRLLSQSHSEMSLVKP